VPTEPSVRCVPQLEEEREFGEADAVVVAERLVSDQARGEK
jgi:hypothetical protein